MKNIAATVALLFGSFILHFIGFGLLQSFGILYSELLEYFKSGKSETSWIASLNSGLLFGCGAPGGILVKHYGCRKVAIFGAILATVGMASCFFVPSLYFLYLTYGVIAGVGMGHFQFAAEVSVAVGFDKHRSKAMAIASSGGGIGTFALPLLTTYCLEQYGWRGTFLILAGIMLQGVIAGAMLKVNTPNIKEGNKSEIAVIDIVKQSCTNVGFILFIISSIFILLVYFIPYLMFPDYVKNKGLSREKAAMVVTVSGISGIFGRVLIGLIADTRYANRFILRGSALICGGICTIGVTFIDGGYSTYLLYGTIFGICTGVFAFLQPVLVTDLVGTEHLSVAFGILLFISGISVLIGPPVAGLISDLSGRYDEAFIYSGAMFCAGGIVTLIIPLYQRLKYHAKFKLYS